MQKPNLKKVKAIINGIAGSHYVCTRCLKSNRVIRNKT
jgi:large subunit ribosomal protein L28